MKLCQIVPSLEAQYGGPSKSVYEISAAFAAGGHDVELLTTEPGPGGRRIEGGLQVSSFPRTWPGRLCPSRGLRDQLGRSEAEIVHHHGLWLRTLHYAHRAAERRKVPLVISPRGMMSGWSWEHHRWRKDMAARFIHPGALAAASGWHATSASEAEDIRSRGFLQPVCVAPNGVAAPPAGETEAARRYWNKICPATAEKPVALFFSRFHRKKRVLELIDLWLARGPRDWLLLLVGIPQDYSSDMLRDYIIRSAGTGRVFAFSGAAKPAPYAAASLFLLPSRSENFGLVIAEALAHGVPALVTDTTPWSALEAKGAGWCVPWASYPAALDAAVAEGPERLQARGRRARDWVLREYSWDLSARALAEFYHRLAP